MAGKRNWVFRMASFVCVFAFFLVVACGIGADCAFADTESDLAEASDKLEQLGAQLSSTQEQLAVARQSAQELSEASDVKGEEVAAAQDELDACKSTLSDYLLFSYKTGTLTLYDYLLGSQSVSDLINRASYLVRISNAQADAVSAVRDATERLSAEQAELDQRKSDQQAKLDELTSLVESYQTAVNEAASVYDALDEQSKAQLAARQEQSADLATALEAAASADADSQELLQNDSDRDKGIEDSSDSDVISVDSWSGNLSGSRSPDTYLDDVTWTGDSDYIGALASRASSIGSSTSYFITFDNELCRVIVFKRVNGSWQPVKLWNCNGARVTYSGVHAIAHKQICNWADEYFGMGYNDWSSCYIEWYTSDSYGHLRYIPGKGYEDCASIHSTGSSRTGWDNSGCCGLLWENAKWVYDNVPTGTTVYEFEYSSIL